MKTAVIKLGSRISFSANDTSGANGEARSIVKILHGGGAEVHIFTKILKKDNLITDYKWHNLSDDAELKHLDDMDALVVINGNVNFFGGAEDVEQLKNYRIINSFKGPVFYLLCDPELTLKQVWKSVEKKPWASNWSKDELLITRDDIVYLSQPVNTDMVLADLKTNEVKPSRIEHFPFEQFPCLNDSLAFNENPTVDISYGGTMRGGRRIKKMTKFYFGHPDTISVEMFGKIDATDFENIATDLRRPTFTGPVIYDAMLPKMNDAMAHCVIGDPWYEQINDMPQRTYESIWSSVVTFIDEDMDTFRRVYGANSQLSEFLYVSSREDLSEKLLLLKNDVEFRRKIVQDQFDAIGFNPKKYCDQFISKLI